MLNWSLSNLVADAGLCNVLTNSKIKPMLNRQGILSLNYFIAKLGRRCMVAGRDSDMMLENRRAK